MRLGLDTYSMRWQGWDAFQLLDYAALLELDNDQFSERAALAGGMAPWAPLGQGIVDLAGIRDIQRSAATPSGTEREPGSGCARNR